MAHAIATIYTEELKATMRGRFAWLGAAVVLLAVGGLATVATQDSWLDGFGIIAYGLVPMGFIPMAAGMIAAPRVNRFVECVFTAPVNRRDWLAAKFLVLLTLAATYYVALLPMMLVYAAHVGIPPLLHKMLLWTPGLLIASLAVGTLIGVLFIGRSVAAPAGAGMGLLLTYAALMPIQEVMVARGNGTTRISHLALVSPAVLLKNAIGFTLATNRIPATTAMTWVSLAVVVIGALALAGWIFLRAQGVETWEATRGQRWTIAVALLVLFLFPAFAADTNYDTPAPPANNAPTIRGLSFRIESAAALADPGGRPSRGCCGAVLNRDSPLATDQENPRDLLLFLPVDASRKLTSLHAMVAGSDGLEITADPDALNHAAPVLETRAYPNDSGPVSADGQHIATGWMVRIPIALDPTKPWDIGGDRYPLAISATYQVAGEIGPRTFAVRALVNAQVGNAIYQMGAAACFFPLLCLGAGFARWRRTR